MPNTLAQENTATEVPDKWIPTSMSHSSRADSNMPFDLEFLMALAPNSATARECLEILAQQSKLILEMKLRVVQERLKLTDPVELAKQQQEAGLGLS